MQIKKIALATQKSAVVVTLLISALVSPSVFAESEYESLDCAIAKSDVLQASAGLSAARAAGNVVAAIGYTFVLAEASIRADFSC